MSYAQGTSVSIDRSIGEIRQVLTKYKATGLAYAEKSDAAGVTFEMGGRRVRFTIPLPVQGVTKDKRGWAMSKTQTENEARRSWRCLVLAIKSKLECVATGITTFEQEFMAHIVLPNGRTVGDVMIPQIDSAYKSGTMPSLLLGHES